MARRPPVARPGAAGPARALASYHRKRDLRKSGEPAGRAPGLKGTLPVFVVQKHDATSLHYDFRLEAGGVLKSWAVPKGLPARVGDKALAIEVEDHPLGYGNFEGTIPAGNYGAGTVMLWDRGPYALEGDYASAYRKGHLHVALAGEKLRGEWSLVRMRPRAGEKKTAWLIIKHRSSGKLSAGGSGRAARDRSVSTGRSMAEIASGERPDEQPRAGLKKKPLRWRAKLPRGRAEIARPRPRGSSALQKKIGVRGAAPRLRRTLSSR
jgi:bifunctional non-homologous end joining protein LigD